MAVRRRLDQILQSKGQVSEAQIREALTKQSVLGGRLGEHLLKKGGLDESALVDALSEQFGLPGICLEGRTVDPELFEKLPLSTAEQHRCLPLAYDAAKDTLDVAFANPNDRAALRAVSLTVHPTRVAPYVAAAVQIRSALATARLASRSSPDSPEPNPVETMEHADRLLDLLELAVSSGQRVLGQGETGSVWTARLAVEIADRLCLLPQIRRAIRLAALTANIADWRRGMADKPRSETLRRSIAVLRDLDLPWDVISVLQGCLGEQAEESSDSVPTKILRAVWAIADTVPECGDGEQLDAWQNILLESHGKTLDKEIVTAAFLVLRVRSLRQQLGDPVPEIVVIGAGAFADELLGLIRNTPYRVASAQSWEEGVVLLERRRPDLVCVVTSGIRIPPQLVLESQIAEHGLEPSSMILIVPSRRPDAADSKERVESSIVLEEKVGATTVLSRMKTIIRNLAPSSRPSQFPSGRGRDRGPAIVGYLADLGLPDLIQVLSSAQKTARVTLSNPRGEGSLWFDRGQISSAQSDHRSGDDAFFDLLGWTDGRFEVHTAERAPARNITTQTTALLLEGFRRLDESRRAPAPAATAQSSNPCNS